METADPRAELERLQAELATRQSTTFFAHSAIAFTVALIFAGAAAKLFWDSLKLPYLGIGAAILALGLGLFATARYLRGKRALKVEMERFQRLRELRASLGLETAPTGLLPSA